MTKVISFSSGKGGVGKSSLVANLGAIYAKQGFRTLLIDGDWALGKLGILLKVSPQWTIERVLQGDCSVQEAIHQVRPNLSLLGSPSGVTGFEKLGTEQRNQIYFEIESLSSQYDFILFDHSSGVSPDVLQFAAASHQQLVVTTPEPASYTDAYAIIKLLSTTFGVRRFQVLVTMSDRRIETESIIKRFSDHVHQTLDVQTEILDILPREALFSDTSRRQQLFVDCHPSREYSRRLYRVGEKLEQLDLAASPGLSFFQEQQHEFLPMR